MSDLCQQNIVSENLLGEMKPREASKVFSQVVHKRVHLLRLHLLKFPPGGQRV